MTIQKLPSQRSAVEEAPTSRHFGPVLFLFRPLLRLAGAYEPPSSAVKAVARGERYLDAQTAQAQALALALAVAQIDGEANPVDLLSEREFSVFIQLARGMSVAQIAKLGAGNQFELTLVALRWGLIEA